jgi:hypothetical protein
MPIPSGYRKNSPPIEKEGGMTPDIFGNHPDWQCNKEG